MLSKSNLKPFMGIAAIAASLLLIKDTYDGTRQKRIDAVAAAKQSAEWHDMEHNWGHWSGNPAMDHKAHQFRRFLLFGPMNLRMRWVEFKTYANSLVNDVLIQNAIPLGLAVGGAYAAFGKNAIHTTASRFFRFMGSLLPKGWHKPVLSLMSSGVSALGSGIKSLAQIAFRSPGNFAMALGALVFGNFTLQRFRNSYGHEGQENYFRTFINEKTH